MINKKLLKFVPESHRYIKKNVVYQWLGMLSNVLITALFLLFIRSLNYMYLGLVVVLMILRFGVNRQATMNSYQASKIVKKTIREKLYTQLSKIGPRYKETWSTAEIVQLTGEGIEQLESYFGSYIPQFFYALLAPVTLFIIVVFINRPAAFALLICVPLIPVSIVCVQKFAKKLLNKYWSQYTYMGDHFLENIQGLTTLKIYQADAKKHEEMNEEAEKFRKITMRVLTMQLNSITVMDIIAYGGSAVGILFSYLALKQGSINIYQGLFITLISSEFFIPMRMLGSYFHIAMNGMAAADKMFKILEYPIEDNKENLEADSVVLDVSHLSFGYEEEPVLKDISFKAHQGFIGIVGESGSGKSTLAHLLTGKLGHYKGSIKLNNKELETLSFASLQRLMTTVSFDSYLFSGTLRENLLMGNLKADDQEMWQVLEKTGIASFFKEEGLDTVLSEQGNNLSGGQKQRVALARALLKDAPVLILDEATSNIDAESEDAIMKIVQTISKEKLVICITHRLINIKEADHIYVLKQGELVESGTHDSLYYLKHEYSRLYQAQQALENFGGELNGTI